MIRQASTTDLDRDFTLDEAQLAQRKSANLKRLYTVQIPALRASGFIVLCAIAAIQDWRSSTPFPRPDLLWLVAGNLSYAAIAWLVLRFGVARHSGETLGLLLFHLDVLVWLPNLHHMEQSHLFFAYFLLIRVVDQVGFGFRRATYFCHVVTAAYLGYAVLISIVEPAAAVWSDRLGIALTMYLLGLYLALTGRVPERLRQRTRQAIHAARELVGRLAQKAAALEAQTMELEESRRQAEQASLAKSQFLAVTSHELRTPMNGILGAAELLIASPLTPTQQRYVRIAHRSATALLTLIDDVLDLSRIEAGKLALNPTKVDLRALVAEAIDLVGITSRDKPVVLSGEVAAAVPRWVLADSQRIRQLLVNLLHNAVKFTDRGSVRLEVSLLDMTKDVCHVRISVRDTGIGIAAEQIESIFGAFTQADSSSTRRHGGSGLGLAIVKQLTELMGGHVDVESQVGAGSHFWIELPLQTAQDDDEPADTLDSMVDDVSVSVLLAEDDLVNQMVVEGMLNALGCTVQVVENGAAALAAASANHYDIVFMDCHMPGMDGYEAARRIREAESRSGESTSIVALTADSLDSDRARCMEAGMDDFLTKPVSSSQLSTTIERWTGRRTGPATRW